MKNTPKNTPKRKYIPPVNVKPITVYLTTEQHEGAKLLASRETDRLKQAWEQNPSTAIPQRVSVSDIIRGLVAREIAQQPVAPAAPAATQPLPAAPQPRVYTGAEIEAPALETREQMEATLKSYGIVNGQVTTLPRATPATALAGATRKRTRAAKPPKA